jgi:hypothetical protein
VTPEQARAALAGDLPPATLLLGPGAGAVLFEACADRGWEFRWDLNAEAARQVRAEAWIAPAAGVRVLALCLDKAGEQVQNMLLKVLEEPPDTARFVLASAARPLPTVASRCRVLVLGGEDGPAPLDPRDSAAVSAAVRAARTRQPGRLAEAVRGWQPEHARLLRAWAAEAATGQWKQFSPDFAPGAGPREAVRLLAELSRYPGTRLGPLLALEAVFGGT